jgi:hypothetical protein
MSPSKQRFIDVTISANHLGLSHGTGSYVCTYINAVAVLLYTYTYGMVFIT